MSNDQVYNVMSVHHDVYDDYGDCDDDGNVEEPENVKEWSLSKQLTIKKEKLTITNHFTR